MMEVITAYQTKFDYTQMALAAARERDILKARLAQRREQGPKGPEEARGWQRDDRLLYEMYLEQRNVCKELERRARIRQNISAGESFLT